MIFILKYLLILTTNFNSTCVLTHTTAVVLIKSNCDVNEL